MPIFLAQAFLMFGLAAVIPVALHLLQRRQPQPVPFAAVRFLHAALSRTRRARRLTQCLTLLLRILIILALVAAFSQPLIRVSTFLPEGRRTVLLVLDGSASMQTQDGGVSRFETARAWSVDFARSLRPDDLVGVLVPGSLRPHRLFPPVSDHGELFRVLDQLRCGDGRGRPAELAATTLRKAAGELRGIELHLFSDFQANDFPDEDCQMLLDAVNSRHGMLFMNSVARSSVENSGFGDIQFFPPALVGVGKVTIRAEVRGSGGTAVSNLVRVVIAGQEVARVSVEGVAGEPARVTLRIRGDWGDASEIAGYLELEPDPFALDNRHYFCLPRLSGLPALLVGGSGSRDVFFLEKAMRPGGQATTIVVPQVSDWQHFLAEDISSYAFLFLANPETLEGAPLEKLSAYVQNGGTAVLFPGGNGGINVTALRQLPGWGDLEAEVLELPAETLNQVALNDMTSDLGRMVAENIAPPWKIPVRRRLRLGHPSGGIPPMIFADGGAFALSCSIGQGTLWLFSVSANRDWADWPVTPFFLVFMQELMKQSAGTQVRGLQGWVSGQLPMRWTGPENQLTVRMTPPSGRETMLRVQRLERTQPFLLEPLEQAGLYQLAGEGWQRQAAVNIPAAEGELLGRSETDLRRALPGGNVVFSSDPETLRRVAAEQRQGRPLWPLLLLVAFFLCMLEGLFANWRSHSRGRPAKLESALGH